MKIRFFLVSVATIATIVFLIIPWWLPQMIFLSPDFYAFLGLGGGILLMFLWCWVIGDSLLLWIAFRVIIITGGAIGWLFTGVMIKEAFPLVFPYVAAPTVGISVMLFCVSVFYWPEFDKFSIEEDIKS